MAVKWQKWFPLYLAPCCRSGCASALHLVPEESGGETSWRITCLIGAPPSGSFLGVKAVARADLLEAPVCRRGRRHWAVRTSRAAPCRPCPCDRRRAALASTPTARALKPATLRPFVAVEGVVAIPTVSLNRTWCAHGPSAGPSPRKAATASVGTFWDAIWPCDEVDGLRCCSARFARLTAGVRRLPPVREAPPTHVPGGCRR